MRVEKIEAKAKGIVVATADINMPETLNEAVEMFGGGEAGTTRVFGLAMRQYKIGELNRIRDAATGGVKIPKAILEKLKAITDESMLATVCAAMGIDVDAVKKAA